jgi:GntR family transcriptional regulator
MRYKIPDEFGEITKRRGISYYHQLYSLLSAALNDGLIPAGGPLPSESDLMERFGVSRNTVRRALGQLEQEKRIIRRRGSGSYARRVPATALSADVVAEVLHDFTAAKTRSSSRLLRVHTTPTPEFVRRKDPAFGDTSLLVQRCRSVKDQPVMLSTSYVPEDFGRKLSRRDLTRQVVLSALDAAGISPSSAEQITTAIPADAFAARHLGVEPSAALVCIHRLIRDAKGRSIEHQTHMYRADLSYFRTKINIERSPAGMYWSEIQSPRLPAAL